jgi:hypothetical protein
MGALAFLGLLGGILYLAAAGYSAIEIVKHQDRTHIYQVRVITHAESDPPSQSMSRFSPRRLRIRGTDIRASRPRVRSLIQAYSALMFAHRGIQQ